MGKYQKEIQISAVKFYRPGKEKSGRIGMRFLKYKRIVKEIPADARNFGPAFALAKLQCIWTDDRIDSVQRKNREILNYL